MTTDYYQEGKEDALRGANASGFTEEHVRGYFSGLEIRNPIFTILDETFFREGYLGTSSDSQNNASYIAGRLFRQMSVASSGLETKVEPARRREEDPGLDEANERRWEYDLPLITAEERRRGMAEDMDDRYSYDIDS